MSLLLFGGTRLKNRVRESQGFLNLSEMIEKKGFYHNSCDTAAEMLHPRKEFYTTSSSNKQLPKCRS
jgi:hypothetical protein